MLKGESHSAAEWGRRLGISGQTIATRLLSGYSIKQALSPERFTVSTSPIAKVRVGEELTYSKLTEAKIRLIRRDRQRGMSQQKIADKYGVSQSAISSVLNGDTWGHVK